MLLIKILITGPVIVSVFEIFCTCAGHCLIVCYKLKPAKLCNKQGSSSKVVYKQRKVQHLFNRVNNSCKEIIYPLLFWVYYISQIAVSEVTVLLLNKNNSFVS